MKNNTEMRKKIIIFISRLVNAQRSVSFLVDQGGVAFPYLLESKTLSTYNVATISSYMNQA